MLFKWFLIRYFERFNASLTGDYMQICVCAHQKKLMTYPIMVAT